MNYEHCIKCNRVLLSGYSTPIQTGPHSLQLKDTVESFALFKCMLLTSQALQFGLQILECGDEGVVAALGLQLDQQTRDDVESHAREVATARRETKAGG